MKITEEDVVSPNDQELVIKVKAIGLNFADIFAIQGLYSATPKEAFIPGLECSGTITSIGALVRDFKVGDDVMAVTRFGAYTNILTINQAYVQQLPQGWTYADGASYLVQVLTAQYGLMNLGAISKDKTILIHSAAGGVGIWANRIAKYHNAFTIGTVGSASKMDLLTQEGYDMSIIRNPKVFKQDLEDALGDRSLDLIMECIGGSIMKIGYDVLAPMGRHIIYGSAHYSSISDRPNYLRLLPLYLCRPRIDPQKMIALNKSIMAFNLIYLFDNQDIMKSMLMHLELMNLGKPIVGHKFVGFSKLPEAIRLFQSGHTVGKVVVMM